MNPRSILLSGGFVGSESDRLASEERMKQREYLQLRAIAENTPPNYKDQINGHMRWTDDEGRLHREYDLPALIEPGVRKREEWWYHGERWREDDKPHLIIRGDQYWLCDPDPDGRDNIHRIGGPAVIRADGTEEYYEFNRKHRDNGLPAVIRPDGSVEYWVRGKQI